MKYAEGKMVQRQIELLEILGFEWVTERTMQRNVNRKNGTTRIRKPKIKHEEGKDNKEGKQRNRKRKLNHEEGKDSEEDEVKYSEEDTPSAASGNNTNRHEPRWDEQFEALKEFKDRHGHLNFNKVCSADNVV
jgi:hypothetical protein